MRRKGSYKNLSFIFDDELNSAEFLINASDLNSVEAYVEYISLISEYTAIEKPDYIVFNKKESGFVLEKATVGFTKEIIFNQLKAAGVLKILIVVNQHLYDTFYKDIEKRNPLMKSCLSLEETYSWIYNHRYTNLV